MMDCIYSLFADGVYIVAEISMADGFVRILQKRNGDTVRVLYKMHEKPNGERFYTPERFV